MSYTNTYALIYGFVKKIEGDHPMLPVAAIIPETLDPTNFHGSLLSVTEDGRLRGDEYEITWQTGEYTFYGLDSDCFTIEVADDGGFIGPHTSTVESTKDILKDELDRRYDPNYDHEAWMVK